MSNRYLAWTLIVVACGLQAYLVSRGSTYFIDLETVFLPFSLTSFSSYLLEHHLFLPCLIVSIVLPVLSTILSWVFLGLRRKPGWNLALVVDLYFALPSLALVSINLVENLRYHHFGLQNNPEVLLLLLSSLHNLILCSPPVRALIFSRPAPQDSDNELILPITSAR